MIVVILKGREKGSENVPRQENKSFSPITSIEEKTKSRRVNSDVRVYETRTVSGLSGKSLAGNMTWRLHSTPSIVITASRGTSLVELCHKREKLFKDVVKNFPELADDLNVPFLPRTKYIRL